MFKLASVHQLEKPTGTCENCGHGIAQLFYVRDTETGAQKIVGSECVTHFLEPDQRTAAEKLTQRLNRAASQWRKQEPPAREGETRAEYINRRVAEMANAMKGYSVWFKLCQTQRFVSSRSDHDLIDRLLHWRGMEKPVKWGYGEYEAAWYKAASDLSKRRDARIFRRIEAQTGSNHYDFTNKHLSQIRKV